MPLLQAKAHLRGHRTVARTLTVATRILDRATPPSRSVDHSLRHAVRLPRRALALLQAQLLTRSRPHVGRRQAATMCAPVPRRAAVHSRTLVAILWHLYQARHTCRMHRLQHPRASLCLHSQSTTGMLGRKRRLGKSRSTRRKTRPGMGLNTTVRALAGHGRNRPATSLTVRLSLKVSPPHSR